MQYFCRGEPRASINGVWLDPGMVTCLSRCWDCDDQQGRVYVLFELIAGAT